MRESLKKVFGKITNGFWILLTALAVLFGWIPFSSFVCGSIGLVAGYLLSRGFFTIFSSAYYIAIVFGIIGIFHIFPLSYGAVRLKNIFVRNFRREESPETKFSFIKLIREIIPVVSGRLRSPLAFFLVLATLFGLVPIERDKFRPKIWDNLDFVTITVAALFIVCGVGYSFFAWKHSPFLKAGEWLERKASELWTRFENLFIYYPPEAEKQAHFDAAPILAIGGLIYGIIGGLVVSISLAFIISYPFWVTGTTAFFSLFHLSDLRRMFREKMWFGFFGRIIVLLAISSYVAGLVCYVGIGTSNLLLIFIVFGVPIGMICGWIWIWLTQYFPNNRHVQSFDQIGRGAYKLGVFWKEN